MVDKTLNYGRHHIKAFTKGTINGAVILDLGAGGGDDLLLAMANNPDCNLHAIECFGPYQDNLRAKGITVYNVNIENQRLPFEDESVDMIIANQIMEHCKEIWWIMSEITRVLKVNGHFIVGIPNLASLHNRFLLLIGSQPTSIQNNTAHVRGYTKNDFRKFVEGVSGNVYKIERFGGANFYPFPPALAKPLAAILPTCAWAIFFKYTKIKKANDNFKTYPVQQKLETNFYLGN